MEQAWCLQGLCAVTSRRSDCGGRGHKCQDRALPEAQKPITTVETPDAHPIAQIKLQLLKWGIRLHGCSAQSAENLNPNIFPLGDKYSSVTFSLCPLALLACLPQPFVGEVQLVAAGWHHKPVWLHPSPGLLLRPQSWASRY